MLAPDLAAPNAVDVQNCHFRAFAKHPKHV
jgi:hypothetical protein